MAAKRGGPARATAATGGRLVSLVDGKEYAIADGGAGLGRDASNDVVVAQNAVSRHHARIAPGEGGYVVTDLSTNGVWVNGDRVQGTKLLARADVIRLGTEEFRFYADVAPVVRAASPAAPAPAAPPPPPVRPAPPPLSKEPTTLPPLEPAEPAPPPVPAAPESVAIPAPVPDAHPVLATLEIMHEGPRRGERIEIREPLVHVGRGAHNDVAFADDSISDTHAKLQLRDDGWYVVDAGSTNGTFVGGVRITGERRLEGTPDLRFGGMRVRFHSAVEPAAAAGGTRRVSVAAPEGAAASVAKARMPVLGWILIAFVVVIAAIFFFLQRR